MTKKQVKLNQEEKDLFGEWKEYTIEEAAEMQDKLEWNGQEWVEKNENN